MKIRCSSLGLIMTDAKSIDQSLLSEELKAISKKKVKTDDDNARLAPFKDMTLSVGAKTELKNIAKEFVYGFNQVITSKYMDKGIAVEDESIALFNSVFFKNLKKNTVRLENEWITGECDLIDEADDRIIDIKSSWSLATFPALSEDAEDSCYEWQLRGYMMLWGKSKANTAFCLVDTPEELIKYEQKELHEVSNIAPEMRVTCVQYTRDLELEEKIKIKCTTAQKYLLEAVEKIKFEHQ